MNSEATVTISDDDVPGVTVSFEQRTYTVQEGSTTTIKVILSADPERIVIIPISRTDQGGATSADYSGVPARVTFDAGHTERSFTFTAAQDLVNDDGESVKLTFGTLPSQVTVGPTDEATVTISDDDVPSVTVSFEQATYVVAEGGTTTIKITLSADSERTVTIPITKTEHGGATSADYTGVPASVTFDAGEAEEAFTFSATQDAFDEDGGGVRLSFGSSLPTGVIAATPSQTTVQIIDDDTARVTVDPTMLRIAEHATSSYAMVLDSQPAHEVTVTINSPVGTEIVTVQPRLTFTTEDWDEMQSVTVIANPDRDTSDDYGVITHTVDSLDDDYDRVTPSGVAVTVIGDDVPDVAVSFEEGTYSVDEGTTTTIKITLSADPERTVTVPITATDQGGATSADYSDVPGSVTFQAGDMEKSFTFTAIQDSIDDDGESVRLTFGALPSQVTSGPTDEAMVTISDDDVPGVTVNFEQATYVVAEGGTTTVKITLSADPERAVHIPITKTEQGGATSADFIGVPASVTFDAGETEETFTFSATDDAMDDDGEGVRLSIGSSLPTGVTAATPTQTTVHIIDDDTAGVTVDPTMLRIAEHATSSYTMVLDSQPTHEVTVTINSPAGTEILTLRPRLTFTTDNWDIEQSVTVIANPDRDTTDDNGVITHTVDTLDDDYDRVTPSSVAVTVIDDDVPDVAVSFEEGPTPSTRVALPPSRSR